MSVRAFDGGDYIDFAAPAPLVLGLEWTIAAVFEPSVTGTEMVLLAAMDAGDAARATVGVNASGHPFITTYTVQGFVISWAATSITIPEDQPALLVFRCPGSSNGAISYYDGTTWTDAGLIAENGQPGDTAGGRIRVGRFGTDTGSDFQGGLSAIAVANGHVATLTETHALAAGDNITWGNVIAWTEIWEFQGASSVTGLYGVADSTSITGNSTITAADPPSNIYTVGVPWTSAPQLTVAPALSGTVQPGFTVTSSHGSWRGSPTGYGYQWRLDSVDQAGETTNGYAVTPPDIAHLLLCRVTATNGFGSSTSDSAASRVIPNPMSAAPATVLVADSLVSGDWTSRTVRYVDGDVWT